MQFKALPEKRAVPTFVKKSAAQNVVLELMKANAAERSMLQQRIETERKRADSLVAALSLQVYKKRKSNDPFVRVMSELIAEYKVEVITYEGETLMPEMETAADIVEWLPASDNATECVAEAIEPEIRYQGRILHRAKLSCRKAPEPKPEPEPVQETTLEQEPEKPSIDAEIKENEEPESNPTIPLESEPEKPDLKTRLKRIIGKLFSKLRRSEKRKAEIKTENTTEQTDDTSGEMEGSEKHENQ